MLVLIVARLPFALEKLMQVETVYIYGTIAVYTVYILPSLRDRHIQRLYYRTVVIRTCPGYHLLKSS